MRLNSIVVSLLLIFSLVAGNLSGQQLRNDLPDWALGNFTRPGGVNPIVSPDGHSRFFDPMTGRLLDWESNDTFNPAAVAKDGKIYILYRAEDKSGQGIGGRTSRIGIAESSDGLKLKRSDKPILFPANDNQKDFEWSGGCEDPRVAVTEEGTYLMLYTQWNHKVPRLAAATSRDLVHWKKSGPVFREACQGKFFNMPTKSASILTRLVKDKLVIAKVNGTYWMYWGEANVYAATSTDLVNWKPLVDGESNLKILMSPRKGYFDSQLTECGPPSIITSKGIVLMYNGKNLPGSDGDANYTAGAYCAGQALFSLKNPEKLVTRLDKPFFVPTSSFEKSGQYPAGTVFLEGLVYFKKTWFLYYGCADSRVAVAVCGPAKPVR